MAARVDLDKPQWDQNTFEGRLKYFFNITDPRTALCSEKQLDDAKELLQKYRLGQEPPGTTEEQIWYAKKLYDSAFHPDSGDKMNVIGRMSFQVPGGMAITGCMLQFYRTNPQVIFWQWVNQSFNALVNYTNRNAESDMTNKKIAVAYISATTSALVTAIGLKGFLAKKSSSLMQRFVPFAAVAAANCVNIPLMRQSELQNGIMTTDENGNKLVESRVAAVKGISQVCFSRITMAAPGMLLTPVIMEKLETYSWMQRIKPLHAVFQVLFAGAFLVFMTPTACALFPQRSTISVKTLERWEPEQYTKLQTKLGKNTPEVLYFNKGL